MESAHTRGRSPAPRTHLDIGIPMRDGTRLSADLFLPEDPRPAPVLLTRTPYGLDQPPYVPWAMRFADAGYAVMIADVRGRYDSDGAWEPYIHEREDGDATIRWIAGQPWSNGQVGMFGISYVGFTQTLAALAAPPALKAIMPIASQEDNFGHMWYDGVLQLENAVNYARIGRHVSRVAETAFLDTDSIYRTLPLRNALRDAAQCPPYECFLDHPTLDQFWLAQSLKGNYGSVATPAFFVTGWYDNLLHEQFKCFRGWQSAASEAAHLTRIMVGPWSHSEIGSSLCVGLDFGQAAAVDMPDLHLKWYDACLRGARNGMHEAPPVDVFVTGANRWRSEAQWPPTDVTTAPLYLSGNGAERVGERGGALAWEPPGDEAPDVYLYDPHNPVPTVGGQSMFTERAGPRDRRTVEQRADVLVYTSAPLSEPVAICGEVRARLFADSSATDTDFTATLVDVDEADRAMILCEGIVRARYRESLSSPALIEPEQVYEYTISLWERAHVFLPGHRIRCEVSSSNFPRFDRNRNVGDSLVDGSRCQTAKQRVWHDASRASCLLLPIADHRR